MIPHPDDATHYRLSPDARALWGRHNVGVQGRFCITMQAFAMVSGINPVAKLIRPLPQTTGDGRPLYSFRWTDLEVTFTYADDGIPVVQHFVPDPVPPPPPR